MSNKKLVIFLTGLVTIFVIFFFGTSVRASVVPTLSLSDVHVGGSSRINVSADPNSTVTLYYGLGGGSIVAIGSTDQNGNFSTQLSTDSYAVTCGNIAYVIINNMRSSTITWAPPNANCDTTSSSSNNPSFSQNNLVLNVGQSQSVTVYGTGGFYISSNPNSNIINATMNGSTLNITAANFGGSNITVCESDGKCGVVYVVSVNSGGQSNTSNNRIPSLTSFNVSSNNLNGYFISAGNVLTLSFNTNQAVNSPSITVNGLRLGLTGNGSGPYSATYTVTGSEATTIPVIINFTDLSGNKNQLNFSLSGAALLSNQTVQTPPVVKTPEATKSSFKFSEFITIGSTGEEVTQLQKRLTTLGFYTGPITGKFGGLTKAAVMKFQKAYGIDQAGYVGPSTRSILNKS